MPRRVISLFCRRDTWIASALIFAFVATVYFMDDGDAVEVFNGVLFGVSLGVLVTYGPAFIRSVKDEHRDSTQILILGIFLGWFGTLVHRLTSTVWRAWGRPDWLAEHWIWTVPIGISIIAGTLHITAPHAIDGKVPTRNWVRWGLFVALGTILAVTYIWSMQPG